MARARRKSKPSSYKRIQDLGYKAVTSYLPEATYQALRRCAFERELAHSELIRKLVEDELRRRGFLKG